jgi:transcription-repair coupling factor (superfamily II helicase)
VDSQLSKEKRPTVSIVPEMAAQAEGQLVPFLHFLPADSLLVMKDFLWIRERMDAIYQEQMVPQSAWAEEDHPAMTTSEMQQHLTEGGDFMQQALDFRRIEFGAKATGTPQAVLQFDTVPQPIFHKNFDLVAQSFTDFLARGYIIYICTDSETQATRLRDIFDERGDKVTFTPVNRTLHEGFTDNTLKACYFTDHQIFDRFHKYSLRSDKARSGKVALTLKELSCFEPGDYVVHIDHGVGKFAGLVRIPNGNTTQEVIKLVFQNDDVVFVSIHSLHKISKYKGKEGEVPRLNKLGTGAWEKLKDRTKAKIKDIARDLIRLYSQRRQEKGYAYSPDSFMQHELEASFLYEDTPDQLKATQEVKHDMESDRPMDRLVCGDVGFGKTEVAIRAAFKAVTDNKQVAVLVPTTVLAYQHFQTFSERLKDFPCRVEYLSRARSAKDTARIVKELAEGQVNILIGTHKIIGKSVKFKDLGLLIIDEEQKFGVSTKEKLRQIKVNVDTLTMTATPIPRTLQFSLMGARDLSVIQTPPPNRYPIQTEVHTFNEDIITEAINFEMSRNGQVFFVNNRIQNLEELAAMIRRNIPDCRVCIGHGQMDPEKLEKIILDFVNYDYDVLLATTIVESGIDIPNANTIIINQAQNFGLSDLHQMRGRVGRSNKKAFCYLLAPPMSTLTQEARRRLQAIENFSDLGSGIHIAMQDLDIRGAGNMLGAEQSGFIADLGYETYQKILAEAVKELRDDEFADLGREETQDGTPQLTGTDFVEECQVESDLELLFPNEYITGSSERMLMYRELDGLNTDAEVAAFRLRLEDRFGKLPPESEELLRIVPLRRMAKQLGVERLILKAGRMSLYFVSNPDSPFYQSVAFGKVIHYMSQHPRQCNLREVNGKRSMLVQHVDRVETAVSILLDICQ